MKIQIEEDHGRVVFAKMNAKSPLWAGIIISAKKLNLIFEDNPDRIWVWWLAAHSFTQLHSNLIYDFCENSDVRLDGKITKQRLNGIIKALEILSIQYDFDLPKDMTPESLIMWGKSSLQLLTKNKTGKQRHQGFYIPLEDLEKMKLINIKNKNCLEKQLLNDNTVKQENKRTNDVPCTTKSKLKECYSCRKYQKTLLHKHPIFLGSICNSCHDNLEYILMPIASDKSNSGCCVCFKTYNCEDNVLLLCNFCVRAFCKECVEHYCGQLELDNVLNAPNWECYACCSTRSIPSILHRYMIKEQLNNIYSLYPAADISNTIIKTNILKIFAMDDTQKIVPTILHQFHNIKHALHNNYETFINNDDTNGVKLLLQYYSYGNDRDSNGLDSSGSGKDFMKVFFNFIKVKYNLESLRKPNEPNIFYAFESSASMLMEVQKTISRFLGVRPILIGTDTKDVRQRGRFVWSNVTILKSNITIINQQNIFCYNIHNQDENIQPVASYTSLHTVLNCLIKNNLEIV